MIRDVAKNLNDRKLQRALMQFFKPANWFTVREALLEAKRTDLIGDGCDCLIPADPPKEALEKRRREAQREVEGDHYHTIVNASKSERRGERGPEPAKKGYRPGRKSARRQNQKRDRKGPASQGP
jgi:uncharacterized protein DUF3362